MKKFTNPVSAFVELREAGDSIVFANVGVNLPMCLYDSLALKASILDRLLDDRTVCYRLDDGRFVVVPVSRDVEFLARHSIPVGTCSIEFDILMEVQDGSLRTAHFVLGKSDAPRRDCFSLTSRTVFLFGTVTIDVDENEEDED